ncbi:hypothetical protein LguiA_025172 [Lonicera macranthoides]
MSYGERIAYDIVLSLLSTSLVILAILLFIFYKKKKPLKPKETLNPITSCACPYSLMDIDAATDGFNHRRIIGSGRLGTVYAAVRCTGELVTVKRIHPRLVLCNAGFGFSSIVKSLSLAHHPHVVPVLGFSEGPGERIIVMEFVGMMSLDLYLHQKSDGVPLLDWDRRLGIAAGAARGVEYLHEVMVPPIVHGSIKPSNILIDVKFCARVCDYGLSFFAPKERNGLSGYVDDEYWVKGGSKENDVYGLGVVLLELLSGRRSEEGLIVRWALPLIKEMKLRELLDPRLEMPNDMKSIVRLAKVALACVGNSRKNRPSIGQVVSILNNLEDMMELCI